MNINFDYKICNLEDYLTKDEFNKFNTLVTDFDVDVNDIKSALGFLQWSKRVEETLKEKDLNRYNKINDTYSIDYNDYRYLNYLNDENGFDQNDYFNFLLTHRNDIIRVNGLYELITESYKNILYEIFGLKLNPLYQNTLIGHINVYPQGSFIKKHFDSDPNNERLFTAVFFLNNDRKFDDGSLLKLYTKNGEIEVLPDFKKCVLIEHKDYNYIHEVTKNLSDDIRYSVYCPFTINDYEQKLIKP